jgi:hypothetical protein
MTTDLLDPFMKTQRGSRRSGFIEMSARVLGRVAAKALGSDSPWEVAAVFRRSVYCRSRIGSFVCFGPTSLGNGPLNVLCEMSEPIDWETVRLTPGSPAVRDGTFFRIAERIIVSLSEATEWRPTSSVALWHAATICEGLSILAAEVRARPVRGGLQALSPILAGDAGASPPSAFATSPLLRMAMESIEPLREWLETCLEDPAEPRHAPMPAIDALIGLGPGLTPSGDDFLGGMLVTLHHLGASKVAGELAREVCARAEQRTNEISYAHLTAAADGEGLAPLHVVLESLCTRGAPGLGQWLSAVDAIGHTSGWDALAGIVFAAATVARSKAAHDAVGGCDLKRSR